MLDNRPMISVCLITYNHEEYIAEAIESILMQKFNYSIEIVIGDDFSTDRTGTICRLYSEQYSFIRVITPAENIGMSRNFIRTSKECIGKYIAMLEGDDYWIDPYKLQKQVTFLEKNLDCILCFHNRNEYNENIINSRLLHNYTHEKHFVQEEVFEANIHTLTVVFRNILKEKPYPIEYGNLPFYDFPLWAYLSLYGKCAYLNFVGATYRLHDKGVFTGATTVTNYLKLLYCLKSIMNSFPKNYQKKFRSSILMLNHMIIEEERKNGSYIKLLLYFIVLLLRSIQFTDFIYIKFYFSHYKTNAKKSLKLFISSIN